jgi:hypothetical protein
MKYLSAVRSDAALKKLTSRVFSVVVDSILLNDRHNIKENNKVNSTSRLKHFRIIFDDSHMTRMYTFY